MNATIRKMVEHLHDCVEDMLTRGQLAEAESFCADAFDYVFGAGEPEEAAAFADDAELIHAMRDGSYTDMLRPKQPQQFALLW